MPKAVNLGGYIGRMVERVKLTKGVGTCAGVFRVTDPHSGNGDSSNLDRFTLIFPYGGLYLKWEVIFNINCPDQPPDFIFLADANSFHPDIRQLKSLATWSSRDADSLLKLLRELLEQYKQQQLARLADTSLSAELQALLHFKQQHNEQLIANVEDHHQRFMEVEVFAGPSEEQAHVMTRIPVFLPNSSKPLQKEHEKMLVLLTYARADEGGIGPVCQVFPSPGLEKALLSLGGISCLAQHKGSSMLDHVSHVTNKLECMVEELRLGVESRKGYVESMISQFLSHVVEYDSSTFHNVSLLFSIQNSLFLLTIDISATFPTSQPSLIFTSMQKQERGLPLSKRIRNYPYSPRWSPQEMACRMRKFLETNISSIDKDLHST